MNIKNNSVAIIILSTLASSVYGLTGSLGGVGEYNGVEWQIDMPWRMEPAKVVTQAYNPNTTIIKANSDRLTKTQTIFTKTRKQYKTEYDPIPLTFTINDAGQQQGDKIAFNRFCGMYVVEFESSIPGENEKPAPITDVTFIPPSDFYEIEASKKWNTLGIIESPIEASHQLWRKGEPLGNIITINDWSEWNGTAYYRPKNKYLKGKNLRIIAAARISRTNTCSPQNFSSLDILHKLEGAVNKSKLHGFGYAPLRRRADKEFEKNDSIILGDFLRTHYASAPLPRFNNKWVYGDLHYHSQGTDNEGESGTSYRSVLATMKAIGLDYTFATDHASDSDQITGLQDIAIKESKTGDWSIHGWSFKDWLINNTIKGMSIPALLKIEAKRDMGSERYAHLKEWLQGYGGANDEVVQRPGSKRLPQLFLGGEVDVIPEISEEDNDNGSYHYGSNALYRWRSACYAIPQLAVDHLDFSDQCANGALEVHGGDNGRVLLRDVQGILTSYFARQHLLYLPRKETGNAFLSSKTSMLGGASRSLRSAKISDTNKPNGVLNELDLMENPGYLFLAHPVSAANGNGVGRIAGPDIYPYSETQLEVAFNSRHVLGLQLWNENPRFHSKVKNTLSQNFPFLNYDTFHYNYNRGFSYWTPSTWDQLNWKWGELNDDALKSSLIHGTAMWDMVNLWGINPKKTGSVDFLAKGEPRKFFMAGGSDAHGDMNYRREGSPHKSWDKAHDTTIGTPRNMTYVGSNREGNSNGHPTIGQNQVLDGLIAGRFSVTDGPAFRVAIDVNKNGIIDDQDIHMGEDTTMAIAQGGKKPSPISILTPKVFSSSKIKLIVEWKSTAEWGPVKKIQLLVGVQAGKHSGLIYQHRASSICGNNNLLRDENGRKYCPTVDDQYVKDPTNKLTFIIPRSKGMAGRKVIELDVFDYKLFDKECKNVNRTMARTIRPNNPKETLNDPILAPSTPMVCKATNIKNPQRMFIRGITTTLDKTNPPVIDDMTDPVATAEKPKKRELNRFAFSNPIWIRDIPIYVIDQTKK